jgi:hypothetical protein
MRGVPGVMEKEQEIKVIYTNALFLDVRVPLDGVLYVGTKKMNVDSQNSPYLESVS